MKISDAIISSTIKSFVMVMGKGDLFDRVFNEVRRVQTSMPSATSSEKRAKVIANAKIIFDDVIVPVGENLVRLLLELAVLYMKSKAGK